MPPIDWNEKYRVNVKEIDDEHKKLFLLLNKLQDGMNTGKSSEELGNALSELVDNTVLHFATEEKLMQQFSYIGFVEHKRVHDDLIAEAKELQEKFSQGRIVLSEEVSVFLSDWLTEHIIDMDKKYAPLFKNKGESL
jgi:hemerythrin